MKDKWRQVGYDACLDAFRDAQTMAVADFRAAIAEMGGDASNENCRLALAIQYLTLNNEMYREHGEKHG